MDVRGLLAASLGGLPVAVWLFIALVTGASLVMALALVARPTRAVVAERDGDRLRQRL